MPHFIDLTGRKFSRLIVLSRETTGRSTRWKCECECGGTSVVASWDLKTGAVKSCGCWNREVSMARATKHGRAGSSEYSAWLNMRARCTNKNRSDYGYYGGRGIQVCKAWANSFTSFLEDMGEKPSPSLSLDRIDPNGDYSRDNCRWASKSVQARNTRIAKSNKTGVTGVQWLKRDRRWFATISRDNERYKLGYFTDFFEACCARKSAELKYWAN